MKKSVLFSFCMFCSHMALANDALFIQLDANSDGSISIEEAAADASVSAKFIELDIDKNGYLSAEEFENL